MLNTNDNTKQRIFTRLAETEENTVENLKIYEATLQDLLTKTSEYSNLNNKQQMEILELLQQIQTKYPV